jgi:CRISPR/Cas system CMR-associated protein Cmr5 small subunit
MGVVMCTCLLCEHFYLETISNQNYLITYIRVCSLSSTTSRSGVWPSPTIGLRTVQNFWITVDFFRSKWPKHIRIKSAVKRSVALKDHLINKWTVKNDLIDFEDPPTTSQSTTESPAKESQRYYSTWTNVELTLCHRIRQHRTKFVD